ncbi:MAG TPA: metallopeptidase TldD-related protein [Kofleriaceae bacterium]|nr:metallopeptidase TldD-related protein [Kofleriaceae bacterium]
MIDRKKLVRALDRRGVSDWVLLHHDQELAVAGGEPELRRTEHRTIWNLTVHHDTPQGRGTAHIALDANERDADEIVEQALALAVSSVGPGWSSPPLAAPARVEVADASLADRDLLDAATKLAHAVPKLDGASAIATARLLREKVSATARGGLKREWPATSVRVDTVVRSQQASLSVRREARRVADLDLDAAIRSAADDLVLLPQGSAAVPGPCALVLRAEALLFGGLGVWQAFVSQADAVVERQGLTRYRERAAIAPGADQIAEPLTIRSNGAVDHGLESAPMSDDGGAIRAFTLVDKGMASGLGLSPREAALRKREPNGGVRNVVVDVGSWDGAIDPKGGRTIEVKRLRSMTIDPYTGDASLELALSIDHPLRTAFVGGAVRLDLIAALAKARRSKAKLDRGAYSGPDAVYVAKVELIA